MDERKLALVSSRQEIAWLTVIAHGSLHTAIQASLVLLGRKAARTQSVANFPFSLFPFLVNVNPSCATLYHDAAGKMRP